MKAKAKVVFLKTSWRMRGQYLETGHNRFHPTLVPQTFRRYTNLAVETASLHNLQTN